MPDVPSAADTAVDRHHPRALFALPADALYLNAAAQGPRLRSVIAAGHAALQAGTAPWRLDEADWLVAIERLRARVAALLDDAADGVALVPSVAYGLATAARNLPLASGDAVLVLDTAFPSDLLTWQQRCAQVGARVVVARRAAGRDDTDAVLAALAADPRIRVVSVSHAHWVDGALLELDRVAEHAHAVGAALVLDLSQSLGVLRADLARWRPAFVVCVGYKWLLGPPGLAYLWAAPEWRERGIAIEQHWSARDAGAGWRFGDDAPPYRRGARRFDAGGATAPLALAMADAGLAQVQTWGSERIATRLGELTTTLDTQMQARGLGAWVPARHAPHLLGLSPPPERFKVAAAALAAAGVICTARYGRLRIAPHLHVDNDAMRRVAELLAGTAGQPSRVSA